MGFSNKYMVNNALNCFGALLLAESVYGVSGSVTGMPIVLRPVSSEDAMTADWSRVPYDVLATISTRITNECRHRSRAPHP